MRNIDITNPHVKPVDLMHVTRQLSAFIRAGIPIFTAISELASDADSRPLKRVLTQISVDLRSGSTLSTAVARFPRDFPKYYPGILQSAEATGRLDVVLGQLAAYLERDIEARRKIKSVMTYPVIVAVMALGTVVVLTAFVLPQFTTFFEQMHVELPAPTRALMATTSFIRQWWWLIVGVFAALTIAYVAAMRQRWARRVRDRIVLRLPVMGPTVRCAVVERMTRILGSLVAAGITLPVALEITGACLNNVVFEDAIDEVRGEMIAGAGLAGPMSRTGLLPGMALQMIRVGQETGTLDEQLRFAAEFYAMDLDYKAKRLAAAFEPLIIVVMGGLVGFVAIALVSAMFGVYNAGSVS